MIDTPQGEGTGFRVTPVLAETPATLYLDLAARLKAVRDPWARHWLVLPGRGRGAWVQQQWAKLAGVASRSQMLSVRALVELAAAGGDEQRRFDLDDLTLRIAAVLDRYAGRVPLPEKVFAQDADGTVVDGARLSWARQLADGIDMALLCREPGERFANAVFLEELAADPGVAPALRHHIGQLPAQQFGNAATDWVAHWDRREGVPHCWIGLDVGLPTVLMARLLQLIDLMPQDRVHLSVLAPSLLYYWGDMATGARYRAAPLEDQPGPILGAFGQRARDLQVQLAGTLLAEGSAEELQAAPGPDHLLGRLQATCRELVAPDPAPPLAADDHSFSVHACRSQLREFEVCRDRILQAFSQDETLHPEDVLVLLTDPTTQAPLVGAAFHAAAQVGKRLPFRLTAAAGARTAAVAEGVRVVLAAATGRFDQQHLLALIEHPLVAQRFGIGDGASVLDWIQAAGFRWGIDAQHRQSVQGAATPAWHCAGALRRLALGAIVDPSHRDGLVAGVAPLARASGIATAQLARLAQLLEHLADAQALWADHRAQPLSAWCERVGDLVDTFLADGDPDQQQERNSLLHHGLANLSRRGDGSARLTADAFRRLLDPVLDALGGAYGSGGGGITVGTLLEHAGTPARVVVCCGLGEASFPRRDERPDWHPLAGPRRPGDPQRRDDDRHALLLALLAAGDRFICTYEGGSDVDDKERPPSTPLADLLASARACCADADRDRLVHRHPLNGFTMDPHRPTVPVDGRGFHQPDVVGARALARAQVDPAPPGGLWRQALPDPDEAGGTIGRSDLDALMKEPCRLFLRRIGIELPEEVAAPELGDRFDLPPLDAWQERRNLLRQRLAGGSDDGRRARLRAAGTLPPGRFGDEAWERILSDTPTWDLAAHPLTQLPEAGPINVTNSAGHTWVVDAPTRESWWLDEAGHAHCFSASKRRPNKKDAPAVPQAKDFPFMVDLLLAATAQGVQRLSVHFATGGRLDLQAPAQDRLGPLLVELVDLVRQARRCALPWWPATHDLLDEKIGLINGQTYPDSLDEATRATTVAWAEPPDGGATGAPATAASPATAMVFRGLDDPFTWSGPEGCTERRYPHLPFAIEIYVAYQRWAANIRNGVGDAENPS
jgi:exonuclease V gamma subunit